LNTEQIIINKVEESQDEIVSFVQSVVRIPSVTGDEKGIGQAIYAKMIQEGIDAQIIEAESHRPNVVGRYRGQAPGKTLVFNGHMDICPPGPEEEWDFPPYEGAIVDGYLQGRGTVDMKSGTCGGLLAVKMIKELGIPIKGDVLLTCVCDEEIGGRLGIRHLCNNGYLQGDYAINCEATNLKSVDVVHKGILQIDVIIYGRSIHGSRPWLGINAIDKAVDLLIRLRKLEKEIHTRTNPFLRPATLNVGCIQGGTVPNMIPGKCVIELNRRLVPGETFPQAEEEIRKVCAEMAADDPEFKYEVRVKDFNMPIMDTPPESPVVQAIRKAHKMVHGEELKVGGKDAGTDAAWIVKLTGIPCPVYGPGDYLKYSLGPNERIPVKDILDAVKVYALTIYYLLGADQQ
jgi:acetylornithine deacetylase/succinyl-diaminopimelate desuccinylase family protein